MSDQADAIIELCGVPREDKPIVRNLLELYRYDYSEFSGEDVGPYGLFGYTYLEHYWTEPDRYPFIIRIQSQLAQDG